MHIASMTSDSGAASMTASGVGSMTSGVASMISGVTFPGKDNRGWDVIDVPPKSQTEQLPTTLNIKIGGKCLELVQQSEPMRVYSNPKNGEADEWEIPAGSDVRLIIPPKESTKEPEESEEPAGFMTV